jgi:nitrous oxidase accessory protein
VLHLRSIFAALAGIAGALVALADPPAQTASAARDERPMDVLKARVAAAAPGDTVEVEPGTYVGHLVIDRSVKLVAHVGARRPVLDAGGRGDVVEIKAENVELRGFVVQRTGIDLDGENVGVRVLAAGAVIEDNEFRDVLFGIDCKSAPRCTIRHNVIGGKNLNIARRGDAIRLWRSDDTLIEGNTMRDGRDALLWYSKGVVVRNNIAERCRYGLHLMYSNEVTIEGNTLTSNSVGVYFMYSSGVKLHDNRILRNRGPSGYGIGLKDTDGFEIQNNLLAGNRVGIYIDNSPVVKTPGVLIAHNTLSVNDVGMQFLPSVKGNTLTQNDFLDNIEQVSILGRGELTGNEFQIAGRGNFWSDYSGYDINGDGVGESEYESHHLFESLIDREPTLRLLLFSPAEQAIEFVGRALPAVEPETRFSDPAPLVRPANAGMQVAAGAAPTSGPSSLVLLGIAGAIGLVAFPLRLRERARGGASVVAPWKGATV